MGLILLVGLFPLNSFKSAERQREIETNETGEYEQKAKKQLWWFKKLKITG